MSHPPAFEPEGEAGPVESGLVRTVCSRDAVLGGVKSRVGVLWEITTPPPPEGQERPALRVAVVLDVSGSMSGVKLEQSKRAITKLVKHLGEHDTLHLISYNNSATVEFSHGDLSETGKPGLVAAIHAVRASGGTNLGAGLDAAHALLQKEPSGVKRVFLFSDGHVNAGETSKGALAAKTSAMAASGVTTSSFGIGTGFDEPLMRAIAEAGQGHYCFLVEREIPQLVSKAVHGLLELYASEARLELRGGLWTTADLGAQGEMNLGDLHYGSTRRVLGFLDCAPPGRGASECTAEWALTFERGGTTQSSGEVQLRVVTDRQQLGPEAAEVARAAAIQAAADLDVKAADRLALRDRDGARDLKREQVALLERCLVQHGDDGALGRVLERAQRVQRQLEEEDMEVVRRRCVQEEELNRCMSVAGWRSGCDSDDGDVADLRDLDGFSDSDSDSSPRSLAPRPRSRSPRPPAPGSPSGAPSRAAEPPRGLAGLVARVLPWFRS